MDENKVSGLENVNLEKRKTLPKDYHCKCSYCKKFMGTLVRPDGTKYSRNDRRKYYSKAEIAKTDGSKDGHIAKTPLHIARWAVQQFTKPGNWVLDPTMGAGTTGVEALRHGCNVEGVEIQFVDVIQQNWAVNNPFNREAVIHHGDARSLAGMLPKRRRYDLVVNNPPYSGDVSQIGQGGALYDYDKTLNNLAFLKEGAEYYDTMQRIYAECVKHLKPGGRLVIGVKDMMKNKAPYMLHQGLAECVNAIPGLEYEGMVLLPHYPTTLFMNTYPKRYPEIQIPMYQTVLVFRKQGGK